MSAEHQQRCLSTSVCFRLTSINGIFLLSHSICLPFCQLLLDCLSETCSIGLRNNATPQPPAAAPPSYRIWTCMHPPSHYYPTSPASASLPCFYFISSFRELSSLEMRNNDLLHPEECPSPPYHPPNNPSPFSQTPTPPSLPNFLNLNKMRIPQSL